MSKRANKTSIGVFVVGAVVLLVIAILVFGSGDLFKHSDKYVLFFDGSVKGLSEGAPVIFRGVKIGNVKDISLLYDPGTKKVLIPVIVDVELSRVKGAPEKRGYADYNILVKQGLRAKLEIQNFITGQLMLSLDFYPDREEKVYGLIKEYPELPALPISPDIFELMNDIPVKEISSNLEKMTSGVSKLINSEGFYGLKTLLQELTMTARSIRFLTEYLEEHPEAFLKGKPRAKGE
ncbi:MAG: MlaD family protein [Candidatus Omnitrophota bacterium]|jgi:paraquat-inducible protein B